MSSLGGFCWWLELREASAGRFVPVAMIARPEVDYGFVDTSETDLTGRVRRARTTPRAFEMPRIDFVNQPIIEADLEPLFEAADFDYGR